MPQTARLALDRLAALGRAPLDAAAAAHGDAAPDSPRAARALRRLRTAARIAAGAEDGRRQDGATGEEEGNV